MAGVRNQFLVGLLLDDATFEVVKQLIYERRTLPTSLAMMSSHSIRLSKELLDPPFDARVVRERPGSRYKSLLGQPQPALLPVRSGFCMMLRLTDLEANAILSVDSFRASTKSGGEVSGGELFYEAVRASDGQLPLAGASRISLSLHE